MCAVPRERHIPQRPTCGEPRFDWIDAALLEFLLLHLTMKGQLFGELSLGLAQTTEDPEATQELSHGASTRY